MDYDEGGTVTGTTNAVLIDVGTIGAALSSGDRELGESIISVQRPSPAVRQALVELLEGGALIDLWDGHYAEAFMLLCKELGEALPIRRTAMIIGATDPFEIPTDKYGHIGVISAQDASGFLNVHDDLLNPEQQHLRDWWSLAVENNLSVAMFTCVGSSANKTCSRNTQFASSGVRPQVTPIG